MAAPPSVPIPDTPTHLWPLDPIPVAIAGVGFPVSGQCQRTLLGVGRNPQPFLHKLNSNKWGHGDVGHLKKDKGNKKICSLGQKGQLLSAEDLWPDLQQKGASLLPISEGDTVWARHWLCRSSSFTAVPRARMVLRTTLSLACFSPGYTLFQVLGSWTIYLKINL